MVQYSTGRWRQWGLSQFNPIVITRGVHSITIGFNCCYYEESNKWYPIRPLDGASEGCRNSIRFWLRGGVNSIAIWFDCEFICGVRNWITFPIGFDRNWIRRFWLLLDLQRINLQLPSSLCHSKFTLPLKTTKGSFLFRFVHSSGHRCSFQISFRWRKSIVLTFFSPLSLFLSLHFSISFCCCFCWLSRLFSCSIKIPQLVICTVISNQNRRGRGFVGGKFGIRFTINWFPQYLLLAIAGNQ